jgi:hypothetical protein
MLFLIVHVGNNIVRAILVCKKYVKGLATYAQTKVMSSFIVKSNYVLIGKCKFLALAVVNQF